MVPKDKDEPDCLQKQNFLEETKCYLFLIVSPCFTHYHSAARTPEVTTASTALDVHTICMCVCVGELEYADFPE